MAAERGGPDKRSGRSNMSMKAHSVGSQGLVTSIEGLGTMGMTAMYGTPDDAEDVQCDFVLSSTTGHRLVIFRPQPGSATAENFEFLDVLGRQSFEG
ncbi:hypothetical protein [Streptosporangium sp. H16]|uniref:hypothetical protein n=1 Tax=Streptosporangium sp. H16 TaxID=3444184 RepID=UPI003F793510